MVPVHDRSLLVDGNEPIRIPVEGKAQMGPMLQNRPLNRLGVRGAAILVNIQPVRLIGQHDRVRAQIAEKPGRKPDTAPLAQSRTNLSPSKR